MIEKVGVRSSATLLGLCLSLAAVVTPRPASAATTYDTTIKGVYSNEQQVLILLESGHTGESCSDESMAIIDRSTDNWKSMMDLATSAYLSGRPVQVRLAGCMAGFPKVHYVWLR